VTDHHAQMTHVESAVPAATDAADHGDHGSGGHSGHAEMFRVLFWRNLALAVPVLVFSGQIQEWFNYDWSFPGSQWIAPVLGTVIYFFGGKPFLTGGLDEARDRQPGMMLLIALAITVAFVASLVSLTGVLDLEFWWELASLIVIMLLGHWQEMRAIGQARGALAALAELLPDEAERLGVDGDVEIVRIGDLAVGDRLLVRSGARIPADGRIVDGSVEVDESMLTGESNPVAKTEGDDVVAGSIATDNTIRVEVTAVGDDTALGGIQRMVSDAQTSHSRAQAIAIGQQRCCSTWRSDRLRSPQRCGSRSANPTTR
jgi:Cu2+-exporting ATPase